METIYTVGHSTRDADEFVALLRGQGVRLLVDVRRFPGSRRHPQFNAESLARTLANAGIGYRHEPDMGGRREGLAESPNGAWRNAGFRAYADHLGSAEFRSALARLRSDAEATVVAIMCAEAVPWRCHRQLISDALVAGGSEVRHIVSAAEPRAHELNPMARVGPDGLLTYPGEEPEQRELL
ncbi:MAG TPA: DUF488 domain-containing protein [Longimicrobiales bacterium]|nr:DUF488 domain-containing protein [Longimicrobiales bacterium]